MRLNVFLYVCFYRTVVICIVVQYLVSLVIYSAVNVHIRLETRAHVSTYLNRHLCILFLQSHMMTLNLISFHKQLIVDTVQIVSLSSQFHFAQSQFQFFEF